MINFDCTVGSLLRSVRRGQCTNYQAPPSLRRPFTRLPAEIRNQIYEECLVSHSVIDLTALKSQDAQTPRAKGYDLTVQLLVVCRQVWREALPVLYGQNAFHYDLEAMWSYHRPQAWRICFGLELDDLYACLRCQMYQDIKIVPGSSAPTSHPTEEEIWNPNLKLVRQLQVTINPYSYLEWRYRHRTAFPRHNFTCPHNVRYSLPEHLRADLLVIRTPIRALMSSTEDAEQWRRRCDHDQARDYADLVAYAHVHSRFTVLAGKQPMLETTANGSVPAYIRELLRTGLFDTKHTEDSENRQLLDPTSQTQRAIVTAAAQKGDSIFKRSGEELASIAIF
ncbi:hypothetical protein LTR53_005112 [Teratosphaeriaceae sp. CCFEE 6253]|nr:hypothetical protein LTR53_005112 [Teratosphaeriaceae sp. CCFEE 6253]